MISRRGNDDPSTREAEYQARKEPAHVQPELPVAAAFFRGGRDEGAYCARDQQHRGERHDRDRAGRRIEQEGPEYPGRACSGRRRPSRSPAPSPM